MHSLMCRAYWYGEMYAPPILFPEVAHKGGGGYPIFYGGTLFTLVHNNKRHETSISWLQVSRLDPFLSHD